MPDQRFVPKWMGKSVGVLAVVGLLAGAGALFGSSCTDNSGNGKFVEPNRPFPDAAADAASASGDAAIDGATDGRAHPDGANSDLGADR